MSNSNMNNDQAFDLDELMQRCLNNEALVRRVVEAFLESGAQAMGELNYQATTGQWDELGKTAHRLKGASGNVAAHTLQQLAAQIEGFDGQTAEEMEESFLALRQAWQQFETQAESFLGQTSSQQ